MTPNDSQNNSALLQHMATINRLNNKIYNSDSKQIFIFTILNETIHAIRYDRASLWDMEGKKPKILGVSGQADPNKDARLTKQWLAIVSHIKEPKKAQVITEDSLEGAGKILQEYTNTVKATFIWLPIIHEEKLLLGMGLEVFGVIQNPTAVADTLQFLTTYLTPAYGSTWRRLKPKFSLKSKGIGKKQISFAILGLLLLSLLIRVPLRVIAPCEVVAKNPFLITAPLEGIIEKVTVDPGDAVLKDDILVEYDKRVPLRNLRVAHKEVEILQAEANRARTLGLDDKRSRTELGILALKLEKEKVNLNLAKWQASRLTIRSPENGIAMLDNPDNWRGKPVQAGEKILSISDPNHTKIRIWIPEDDNVILDPNTPIKIYLNISPEVSYEANIIYIANESTVSDQNLPSFVAEANWVEQPKNIKLGLKGTSVLYGERVTLLHYFV